MFVPVVYAVLTWYLAARWRRTWRSWLSVLASVAVLILLARLARAWGDHIPVQYRAGLLFFWPYVVLVGGVGAYISLLPRRYTPTQCRACGYELAGLVPMDLQCPECGVPWRGPGSAEHHAIKLTPMQRPTPEDRERALRRKKMI